jgi:hypothetical protein
MQSPASVSCCARLHEEAISISKRNAITAFSGQKYSYGVGSFGMAALTALKPRMTRKDNL